jgi:hypothetical protein
MINTSTADHEQTLITIARTLPFDRVTQLIDFARFLAAQSFAEKMALGENPDEVEADNAAWDALLATDESQNLLDTLADEALAEHRAGHTRPMTFSIDGRIKPG